VGLLYFYDMPIERGWADAKNLLAMRLDNIGDVVMAGPALRTIKEALPDARLTLMVSPAGAGAADLLPWIDDILVRRVVWQDLGRLPFDPAREWNLIRALEAGSFDGAIIFTSFSQSPHPAGLACLLAGIPLRLGSSKETAPGVLTAAVPSPPDCLHQVDRNVELIEAVGFHARNRDLSIVTARCAGATAERLLWAAGLVPGEPYLLVNPFASAQARTYPAGRLVRAVSGLAEATGLRPVVTGTGGEKERATRIAHAIGGRAVNLAGMTTVGELACLVEGAALLLTNNTSTMHIADACGTPSVVLYSGTELKSQWRPRRAPHRLLTKPVPCSPCYAFTCPSGLECLDVPPEEVIRAGLELLFTAPR
jgi:ADP-heptose:LPS heptosyltransferase